MRLLVVFLLLATSTLFSQSGKLAGKIYDATTGEPVLAANVFLENTDLGAASIGEGEYFIVKIPKGNYNVIVSRMGYNQTIVKDVRITQDVTMQLNVSLNPQVDDKVHLNSKIEEFYLNNFSAEVKNELDKLKERNPDRYYRFLMDKYLSSAADGMLLRLENDAINLIEAKLENLSLMYHKSDEKEKSSIKNKIKNHLTELFSLQEELRIKQIFELERKLADFKLAIAELKYKRESLIELRLNKLTKK